MSEWISVKDGLPKGVSQSYITYRPSAPLEAQVASIWYDPQHNGWSGKYNVTQWMPLPKPPTQ